jgi:hypothetical protein
MSASFAVLTVPSRADSATGHHSASVIRAADLWYKPTGSAAAAFHCSAPGPVCLAGKTPEGA